MRDPIRSICGDDIANKCKPIWGLDNEGELNGCWRHLGVKNLWYMTGICSTRVLPYVNLTFFRQFPDGSISLQACGAS
jgi:hypothetical protein